MAAGFCHISMEDIANLVRRAQRLVIYAAPGIDDAIASAILLASKVVSHDAIQVILDVDEDSCRAGYGNADGYSILVEGGVQIRRCQGLRLGFALVDDEGFIFAQPPLMVESSAKLKGCPNAVRATPDMIRALVAATRPPAPTEKTLDAGAPPATNPSHFGEGPKNLPRIGQTFVREEEVHDIQENLRRNPVQDFDLGRIVQVFTAYIQFVELSIEGTNLEHHTVKLPSELLTVVRDQQTRRRLTTAFKLVSDGSKVSGEKIRNTANDIRKRFIKTNSTYGGVVLKSKVPELEKEIGKLRALIDEHKVTVRARFLREAEKSKTELVQAFWRAVRNDPPADLLVQVSGPKPSMEEAKDYLASLLERAFPRVESLCDAMKINFITKDVTWATLNNQDFVAWLKEQFPVNKELKKPFEAYAAARQRPGVSVVPPAQHSLFR